MAEERIERKFDVTGGANLIAANISGTVDIQAGDEGVITIVAVKHEGGDAEHTRVEIGQDDKGVVTAKTDYGDSFWRFFGQRPCDVDYTIRVPSNTLLELKCVSSTASLKGLTGQFNLSTISGDVALSNLAGPLKINLVSASLNGENLVGAGDISTVSGKVTLAGCNLPKLKLSTVSGAVVIETPLADGPYDLHTISGDIHLAVQAATGCTVDFNTLSGRFSSNIPTTHSQQSGRSRRLVLQGGGAAVKFDSISANLLINSAQAVADANTPKSMMNETATTPVVEGLAPITPIPSSPAPQEEISDAAIASAAKTRRDILDRVAQGQLSVSDAVNMLRG